MTFPATPSLLIDLDGTLTDNFPGISRSILYAVARLGVPEPDDAQLRRCVGPPLRESFARLLETADPVRIEEAIALYRERFADVGWRENTVYDGVPEMLQSAAALPGRRFLCTAKPEVFARRIVDLFGFAPYLDGVYGPDLGGRFDNKATLLAHLARSEHLDPTQAIMLGDRAHDVRAARTNGARAIGVLWGYGSAEELADADLVIAHPAELIDAIATIRTRTTTTIGS
jgi:phosphoglycolate phosphatase